MRRVANKYAAPRAISAVTNIPFLISVTIQREASFDDKPTKVFLGTLALRQLLTLARNYPVTRGGIPSRNGLLSPLAMPPKYGPSLRSHSNARALSSALSGINGGRARTALSVALWTGIIAVDNAQPAALHPLIQRYLQSYSGTSSSNSWLN